MKSSDFKRINPYLYEIPASHRADMRVPARFYADAELLQQALGDKSLDQLANSAVIAHAARLLGLPEPPLTPLDIDALPVKAQRFYRENRRVSNARAKAELGWRPAYPTYREGLAAILAGERQT